MNQEIVVEASQILAGGPLAVQVCEWYARAFKALREKDSGQARQCAIECLGFLKKIPEECIQLKSPYITKWVTISGKLCTGQAIGAFNKAGIPWR